MRAPVSWLRELTAIPADQSGRDIAERLTRVGLEVETVDRIGGDVVGDVVVGRVVSIEELAGFKKPIRWCQVDVGPAHGGVRGIICGARNFAAGDLVAVALPGTVLPGGFVISARETYGHVSDGMICSQRELSLGDDHDGIIVMDEGTAGDDAAALLGIGDEVLDIAVTPDRGYALSMRGVAREVAAAYGLPFTDPGTALVDLPAPGGATPWECGSDDLNACDLFTVRTIVGFDPRRPTPTWMRRRLAACGIRSISLAVDVTNYVMLELGQPLHAFDLRSLRGALRAGRPKPGERLETLDHVVRELDPDDLVILDDRGPIGLAGTMGGRDTEISDTTTDIVLEAAHFDPRVVARMARRHRLSSEASRRFERGVDRDLAPYASARAAALLLEHGGGAYAGMTGVEAPDVTRSITMKASLPGRTAGMDIPAADVARHLRAVGCTVVGDQRLEVTPPSWRADLRDPADLIEEVVRLVGYDRLPATLPAARPGFGWTLRQRLIQRVSTTLAAQGLVEVLTYPFIGEADLDALRLAADDPRRQGPRLANPLSDEQPVMATTLLPGLFAAVRRNLSRGLDDVSVFELGPVFLGGRAQVEPCRPSVERRPSDAEIEQLDALLPAQPMHVAAVLVGEREPSGWWGSGRDVSWSDAIGIAREVAGVLGVPVELGAGSDPSFHPGRCAQLRVGTTVIGHAGELHPRVTERAGLPDRACALELDLEPLLALAPQRRSAPALGTYPLAKEDVALVVGSDVHASQVHAALVAGAGDLLEAAVLFDDYVGPQVGEGRRSLAFSLRFRAADRTLTSEEIARARNAAVQRASELVGAVLRGG